MTLVVKLGSSIVAGADGALRTDVLDGVCAQVAELHRGGEEIVMVTSGAIARGRRLLGLAERPAAVDELQAASAVGQGSLFRSYEERLAAGDVRAAQVLLTAFDMSERIHYLNARQTLQRLLGWHVVPVINENDTTATDEITFGDNDFLSAQVAIMIEARHLILLTDQPGLFSADPRLDSGAELVENVGDTAELDRYEIGSRGTQFGSGGMRSKVVAAQMASGSGIGVTICDGTANGTLLAAARGERIGTPSRAATAVRRASSSGFAGRHPPRAGSSSTTVPGASFAKAALRCCRSGSPGSRAASPPATRSRSSTAAGSSARGSPSTHPRSCSDWSASAATRSERSSRRRRGGDPPGSLRD